MKNLVKSKVVSFILIALTAIFVISCGGNYTIEDLENDVKVDIKNERVEGVEVLEVKLAMVEQNLYVGELYTREDGENLYYELTVSTNGLMFEWQLTSDAMYSDEGSSNKEDYEFEDEYSSSEDNDFCDLNNVALLDYLTSNSFNIEGNGNVAFRSHLDYGSNIERPTTIGISGGRAALQGDYSLVGNNRIYVESVSAISGTFDASNNRGSSGYFTLNCEGNLVGSLSDGNNVRNYTFYAN